MENFDPEQEFRTAIDEAIEQAAYMMDMRDVQDVDDEEFDMILEARNHCGTCTVRTVMETVWPEVEKYIHYLKYQDIKHRDN